MNKKSKIQKEADKEIKKAYEANPKRAKEIQATTDLIAKAYKNEIADYTASSFHKLIEVFSQGNDKELVALTYAIVGATFTEGYLAKEREIEKEQKNDN